RNRKLVPLRRFTLARPPRFKTPHTASRFVKSLDAAPVLACEVNRCMAHEKSNETQLARVVRNRECRPCTDRELLHHYCSSDFVAEGVVSSLRHMHRRDVTEIMVSASRVHRDSIEEPAFLPGNDRKMAAVLQRPLKCGTRAGRGHFLFIGVRILGKPTMRCAPRLQYWRKLRDRAIKDGTSMCTLL
ncbi:hypothetical protein MRX96_055991, partial [Rhipicephalus microplus]